MSACSTYVFVARHGACTSFFAAMNFSRHSVNRSDTLSYAHCACCKADSGTGASGSGSSAAPSSGGSSSSGGGGSSPASSAASCAFCAASSFGDLIFISSSAAASCAVDSVSARRRLRPRSSLNASLSTSLLALNSSCFHPASSVHVPLSGSSDAACASLDATMRSWTSFHGSWGSSSASAAGSVGAAAPSASPSASASVSGGGATAASAASVISASVSCPKQLSRPSTTGHGTVSGSISAASTALASTPAWVPASRTTASVRHSRLNSGNGSSGCASGGKRRVSRVETGEIPIRRWAWVNLTGGAVRGCAGFGGDRRALTSAGTSSASSSAIAAVDAIRDALRARARRRHCDAGSEQRPLGGKHQRLPHFTLTKTNVQLLTLN